MVFTGFHSLLTSAAPTCHILGMDCKGRNADKWHKAGKNTYICPKVKIEVAFGQL